MTSGGSRRPAVPKRDSGDQSPTPHELRQRATPGLVPAPLVGMGGAPVPADPDPSRGTAGADDPTGAHHALATICPYLVAEDGGWRAATPMREHRCTAVRPPAPLSDETQRKLCLTDAHVGCSDYLAARQRRAAELAKDRIALDQLDSLRFQPTVRAVPIALERPRRSPAVLVTGRDSRTVLRAARWPLGVAVVIVVVLFGGSKLFSGTPTVSPSPTARSSASGLVAASPTLGTSTPTASATPSQSFTLSPSPPVATRTYKVKKGDTLTKIAQRFGTTVGIIKQLNNMSDPPRIRIGQVLKIP
jgi:LysM repeat protein